VGPAKRRAGAAQYQLQRCYLFRPAALILSVAHQAQHAVWPLRRASGPALHAHCRRGSTPLLIRYASAPRPEYEGVQAARRLVTSTIWPSTWVWPCGTTLLGPRRPTAYRHKPVCAWVST
jgi:hypothetical protein